MLRNMNKFVIVINCLFAIIGDGAPPPEEPLTHTLEARFALFPNSMARGLHTFGQVNNKLSGPFHILTSKHSEAHEASPIEALKFTSAEWVLLSNTIGWLAP